MGAQLDNTAEVETPELVRFRYRVAGPVRRLSAYAIDLLFRVVALVLLWIALSIAFSGGKAFVNGLILICAFVLEWGYYVFFETLRGGQSPGKKFLSLRVVKEGGYPVGFIDSVLRNLLRGADFLPVGYVLGLLAMAGDARFRRLGDRVAATLVVIEMRPEIAPPLTLSPPATPEELAALPARPALSVWERETLDLFLRRSDLTPARRTELARMLAPALAGRMGVASVDDPVRFLALLHHQTHAAVAAAGAVRR
jgi:uncharacterized RDD family membrane protein YckC